MSFIVIHLFISQRTNKYFFFQSKSTLTDRRSQPSIATAPEPEKSPKSSSTENGSLMAALANELKSKQLENEKNEKAAEQQQNFVTVIEVNESVASKEQDQNREPAVKEVPETPPSPPPATEKPKKVAVAVEVVPISLSSKAASQSPTDKINRDRTLCDNENSFTGNDNSNSIERSSSSSNTNPPTSPLSLSDVNKKKVPPRPPPKYGRRIEPPTIPSALSSSSGTKSKENSLERNIKPSDILRNKSATSVEESKAYLHNRNTSPDVSKLVKMNEKQYTMVTDNFQQKTSSLEKSSSLKSNQSGSLGKTTRAGTGTDSPTGSLGKSSSVTKEYSPTGSIDNKSKSSRKYSDDAGSKESLISQGNISEIVSYLKICLYNIHSFSILYFHLNFLH